MGFFRKLRVKSSYFRGIALYYELNAYRICLGSTCVRWFAFYQQSSHTIRMTLQTARSSSSISWIDASLDLRLPYKFVHLFPSYIETSRAVYLWTNIWRRTRLRTPCIMYHSECYKILPGEITLISRWAYFHFTPSSFIIYQTKSTRFLRVQRSSTTWPDDSDTFNHVLLLLFWFFKVHLKTTKKTINGTVYLYATQTKLVLVVANVSKNCVLSTELRACWCLHKAQHLNYANMNAHKECVVNGECRFCTLNDRDFPSHFS